LPRRFGGNLVQALQKIVGLVDLREQADQAPAAARRLVKSRDQLLATVNQGRALFLQVGSAHCCS
jgi:hypothetical protein